MFINDVHHFNDFVFHHRYFLARSLTSSGRSTIWRWLIQQIFLLSPRNHLTYLMTRSPCAVAFMNGQNLAIICPRPAKKFSPHLRDSLSVSHCTKRRQELWPHLRAINQDQQCSYEAIWMHFQCPKIRVSNLVHASPM